MADDFTDGSGSGGSSGSSEEQFRIDGVAIAAPETYKPVFSTTSTKSTKRDQSLTMHNSVMGTIARYDMTWGELTWNETATILNALIDKKSFTFHHKDPRIPGKWIDAVFYCSNYNMDAQTLEENEEKWTGLAINIRRTKKL